MGPEPSFVLLKTRNLLALELGSWFAAGLHANVGSGDWLELIRDGIVVRAVELLVSNPCFTINLWFAWKTVRSSLRSQLVFGALELETVFP